MQHKDKLWLLQAPARIQDDPELRSGGPDRPGCHAAQQPGVQKTLPPVAVLTAGVWPSTEPVGVPVQRVRQENTLPVQVRTSSTQNLLLSNVHVRGTRLASQTE